MKFKGNGSVWDSKNNTVLCSFVDGVFETNNEAVIKDLKEKGFIETDEATSDGTEGVEIAKSFEDFETLRELAKESGITDYEIKTADELKELLEKE